MADYAAIYRRKEARRRRSLITPEGVDLSLRLADIGQRFSALILDLLIMIGVMVLVTIIAGWTALAIGAEGLELAGVIWLLGFFILRNCYFIIFEMGPRAATFGKRIIGLRVVARSGGRLTADSVIARNLMREIELYLPLIYLSYNASQGRADTLMGLLGFGWVAIFLFFPLFNKDRLRVGDLLAGTWVINAPKQALGLDQMRSTQGLPRYSFTAEQLDAYGVYELQTLEQVLRDGQPQALTTVAAAIRKKIGVWDGHDEWVFLTAYYQAARGHMERNLLFGHRREDKFDRAASAATPTPLR